jgi:hypothetical protein
MYYRPAPGSPATSSTMNEPELNHRPSDGEVVDLPHEYTIERR